MGQYRFQTAVYYGGIGATHNGEAFTFAYDLPNDTAYAETCASIGLIFFAHRMLQMDMDSRYGDVMERALYNVVLGPLPGWKAIFLCESFGGLAEGLRRQSG